MCVLKQQKELNMISIFKGYLQKLGIVGHDTTYLEGVLSCESLFIDHEWTLEQVQEHYLEELSHHDHDLDQWLQGYSDFIKQKENTQTKGDTA